MLNILWNMKFSVNNNPVTATSFFPGSNKTRRKTKFLVQPTYIILQPICFNTKGSFTCAVNSAFGDPHFRVTSPGQERRSTRQKVILCETLPESENLL